MSSVPIIIATRGSALALAQAHAVQRQCREAFPGRDFEVRVYKTTGDKLQTASLASSELPKGLFTKELEAALASREADLAVHSLKDLPTSLPAGLVLGAVGRREDPRDVLVVRTVEAGGHRGFGPGVTVESLPQGAVVATSSTRRGAQVAEIRPDVSIIPIRGNVGTRLRKLLENGGMDATMLASAGLRRLGFKVDAEGILSGGPAESEPVPCGRLRVVHLDASRMIPCVGQAAIGIEIREGDDALREVCCRLNHADTWDCVAAERSFLRTMGGGCQAAVAAHATLAAGVLTLHAVSYLGGRPERASGSGPASQAEAMGEALARELLGRA